MYHACSAFYGSGFEEAAALVLDGGGAYVRDYIECRESESMYYFSETGKYKLLSQIYTPNNIAKFDKPLKIEDNKWISSTSSCGGLFNHSCTLSQLHSPGKLMGISPHGNIDEIKDDEWFYYDNETDRWYTHNKNVLNTIRRLYNNDKMHPHYWETFENIKPIFQVNADIGKKIQYETKKHTIRLIELLLSKVETNNVVLSGGYFLNCVNNYEYVKAFPHINFYIDPLAHDGGTAHGGAKYVWHHLLNQKAKYPLKSLFLGG
ncbi:hypothetical protein EB151_09070 [archaeon]|nr:hypothetical protein [archaeon]